MKGDIITDITETKNYKRLLHATLLTIWKIEKISYFLPKKNKINPKTSRPHTNQKL